jgi:hypothetical protein
MKPVSKTHFRKLQRLALWSTGSVALVGACSRPDYQYSDAVPIHGTVATGAGATSSGPTSTGGVAANDPCSGLEGRSGTPAFASQALSNGQPIRAETYLQLTDDELQTLEQTHTLVPKPEQAAPPALTVLLGQLKSLSPQPQASLVSLLASRFKWARPTWPNPWALRLVDHPASEHMNPVRVQFKADAWFARISDRTVSVLDANNSPIALESAIAAPERIAAIYYVIDDTSPGAQNACETGRRELALGNEAMVAKFSVGTNEILARLDADLEALTQLFEVARPCSNVDMGMGTFHAFTVCQTWDYFDAASEYSAYAWALSNPVEAYKPSVQNLSNLVEALKSDRADVAAALEATPSPVSDPIEVGGSAGMAGAAGSGGGGGGSGGGGSGGGGSGGGGWDGGAGP